jgi:6-phosphogluconolactonase
MEDWRLTPEITRRQFVKSAGGFAVACGAARLSVGQTGTSTVFAYVGTYTGSIGGGANGEGIYLFELNPQSGELSRRKLVAKTPSPSWIAIHPTKKYLYAANEIADFNGNSGSVSAFAIDAASGDLTPLNAVSSEGSGPAHLSVDAAGKNAFVANYGGGSVAVLPILPHGALGKATDIHRDTGAVGAAQATSAPPGSFAISGHDAPHAHMIAPDPQGRFVFATDLGQDRIYIYRYDSDSGKLAPNNPEPFVSLPSGDGPRHFVFHPNGRWLYSIQEEASTIALLDYDANTGSLASKPKQTISTLPEGFAGTSFASEIQMAPDGRFVYAANRLQDTIAVFTIGMNGLLTRIGEVSTMGDYPSQFRIEPNGSFLFACNRRSDSITSFKIDRRSGLLTFTGYYAAVGSPGSITFL